MSSEEAIDKLSSGLIGELTRRMSFLHAESDGVVEAWEGLGRVGGQRADHAALLLSRLRPHLRDFASFCRTVEGQIDGMMADPFDRKAVPPC